MFIWFMIFQRNLGRKQSEVEDELKRLESVKDAEIKYMEELQVRVHVVIILFVAVL